LEWQIALILIFSILLILMLTGMHISLTLLSVCLISMYIYFGGLVGWDQLIKSMYTTCNTFLLLPILLFVFMGEVLSHSGISSLLLSAVDKLLGRLPGRLALLSVCAGTLFATLTGTSMASVAMLGATLVPEMEARGYKKPMSLGPILGSGGLAIMIPPSGLAVLMGALAQTSIGQILIAIIVPGLIMAFGYALYIILRCMLQPSIAPPYNVEQCSLSEKTHDFIRYILPLGIVIFLVVGVIFLGIATPSEAAATGAFGTILLAILFRKFSWDMLKRSLRGTVSVSGMMLFIIAGASAFSQVLSFSGATQGLTDIVIKLPVPPLAIIMMMMLMILFLGTMMDVVAIMMITLPIFMPVVKILGFDQVWFCVLFLLNLEMASTTPPFGVALFAMKAVCPQDTTMKDIYLAALPFLGVDLLVMVLFLFFPKILLWLPSFVTIR
jgi:tripartite ATP-independent transporter DctM subunit